MMLSARILVVDDDEMSSRLLSRMLQKLGYEIAGVAVNAVDAIEKATELKPDLALMDIVMPGGMDGADAGDLLVKCLDVPVVYVSGAENEEMLERIGSGESYGFVSKPVNSRQLANSVNMALARHRAEAANRIAQKRLRLAHRAIDSSDDMVVAVDPHYCYLFANTAFLRFYGKTIDEVVGRSVGEIRGALLFESQIKPVIDRCLAGERPQWEAVLPDSNNVNRVHLASFSPLITEGGIVEGVVEVIRDMTELRRAREEMINAQRLESLGTLASGIAHDFNNALGAILGYLDMIKELGYATEPGIKMVESAMKSCMRAKGLSQRLVTFSKGNHPIIEPVSIQGVLAEAAMRAFKGSGITCEWDVEKGLPPADVDAAQISIAIGNLFTNARQAMGDTGRVKTGIHIESFDGNAPPPLCNGAYLRVTVADEGPGIADHDLSRIFDPFFSTRPRSVGLGLAIAFSIIQKHNGHISVVSTGRTGTVFCVWLPLRQGDGVESETAEKPVSIIHGTGHILIMDDEEGLRAMATQMVSSLGYTVTVCSSGEEAVTQYTDALNAGKRFDAVLFDLTVPGAMGGKDALKKLLLIDPGICAIASSGYSDDPVMSAPEKFGFRGVLPKPYTMKNLSQVMQDVLALRSD